VHADRAVLAVSGLVVALRALGLGDFLTGIPALRALQRAHPRQRVVLAAPPALAPLARLAGIELAAAGELQPLAPDLHGAGLLANLHGRGPQSHRVALAARPRRLIAFEHPDVPESAGMPGWRAGEHEVDRWCRLLRDSGIPADPADLRIEPPPAPAWAVGATLIHPGAASAARRWPPARFAAVASHERARGCAVLVTGGAREVAIAREVAHLAGLPESSVLAGRTTLEQLAAVVAGAGRIVSGDTGVAHLATAFARPSVLLFGPTPPSEWGPRTATGGPHRVLWSGRRGDPHADRPDPGLLAIGVDDVVRELAVLP
jgi:ADP-heptose:LPS heptosyltransferase